MRGSEVAIRMAARLPQLTDKFTDEVGVNSCTRSTTVMTVGCDDPHGLEPGQSFAVVSAFTPVSISELKRSGVVGRMVTTTPHDVTYRSASQNSQTTITISGATEGIFNATFDILTVIDRNNIEFAMADSGAVVSTGGTPILEDGFSSRQDYNTTYAVLDVLDEVNFTFTEANTTLVAPNVRDMVIRTKPRIATGGADAERMVSSYTPQASDKLWAYVVLDDVVASKNRAIQSDAVDNQPPGIEFRQQVIQGFTVYVFIPSTSTISGQSSRDLAEDLFRPICQSVLGFQFDSQLFVGSSQGATQFITHGTFRYDSALYVHAYAFQATMDLTFDDTIGDAADVAFRTIDLTMTPQFQLEDIQAQDLTSSAIALDQAAVQEFSTQHGTSVARLVADPIPFYYANTVEATIGIADAWSVGMWLNPLNANPVAAEARQVLFEIGASANDDKLLVEIVNGASPTLQLRAWDDGGVLIKLFNWTTGDNPLEEAAWNYLLFTYDGSTIVLYHNGVAVAPTAGATDDPGTMADTAREIHIGASQGASKGFDGLFHSVGVWNSALAVGEPPALFNAGEGKEVDWYTDSGAYVSSANLQHWWRLGLDPSDPGRDYGLAANRRDVDQNSVGDLVLVRVAP